MFFYIGLHGFDVAKGGKLRKQIFALFENKECVIKNTRIEVCNSTGTYLNKVSDKDGKNQPLIMVFYDDEGYINWVIVALQALGFDIATVKQTFVSIVPQDKITK